MTLCIMGIIMDKDGEGRRAINQSETSVLTSLVLSCGYSQWIEEILFLFLEVINNQYLYCYFSLIDCRWHRLGITSLAHSAHNMKRTGT